jgi:hypothetical protein
VKFPEKGLSTMAAIWPSTERVKAPILGIKKEAATERQVCHKNQNPKNIENFTTQFRRIETKGHNIGTHLKGIETSFQVVVVVPLFF